jgi:hypothetical protein
VVLKGHVYVSAHQRYQLETRSAPNAASSSIHTCTKKQNAQLLITECMMLMLSSLMQPRLSGVGNSASCPHRQGLLDALEKVRLGTLHQTVRCICLTSAGQQLWEVEWRA